MEEVIKMRKHRLLTLVATIAVVVMVATPVVAKAADIFWWLRKFTGME